MKGEYLEMDEKLIKRIEEITNTDYNFDGCKVLAENCISIIEDLIIEYDNVMSEYDDFEAYVEDNYKMKRYEEDL